jgi:hypothetical protein
MDIETVLVTVDGSEESLGAAEHALVLSDRYGADVHALYVLDEEVTETLTTDDRDHDAIAAEMEAFFEEARDIAERAQRATSGGGWSTSGSGQRSRTELITQLLDSRFEPLRRAYFNYHFGGLDHFVSDLETARVTVLEVLRNLQELSQNTPRSYALNQFMTAKQSELMAVFQDSEQSSAAYDVLTQLDPSSNYEKLVN